MACFKYHFCLLIRFVVKLWKWADVDGFYLSPRVPVALECVPVNVDSVMQIDTYTHWIRAVWKCLVSTATTQHCGYVRDASEWTE